jgi:hypothetical protein
VTVDYDGNEQQCAVLRAHFVEKHHYPPAAVAEFTTMRELNLFHQLVHTAVTLAMDGRVHQWEEADGWTNVLVGSRHPFWVAKFHAEDASTTLNPGPGRPNRTDRMNDEFASEPDVASRNTGPTVLGPASEDDLPSGLVDALHAPPEDLFYCMTCDGLRVKGHECQPW